MVRTRIRRRKRNKTRGGAANENVKTNVKTNITPKEIRKIVKVIKPHAEFIFRYQEVDVGIAKLFSDSNEVKIELINVHPNFRGRKIGTFILDYILEFAFSNKKIERVTLVDSRQSNQFNPTKIPNKMYEKLGFIHTDSNLKDEMELTREVYEAKRA